MLHFGNELEIRRHERLLLRPWLENLIDSCKVPGLQWIDSTRSLFRVPWKHQSRKTWSLGHSSVFLEWAKNTGRWKEGDPEPHYAQLKTRLRCAFSKAPDIEEMKDLHCSKVDEPYKVYRFVPKKVSRLYPFGRKAITRKSAYKSLKRNSLVTSNFHHERDAADFDELSGQRKTLNGYEEMQIVRSVELPIDHVKFNLPVMDSASACMNRAPYQVNEFHEQMETANAVQGRPSENGFTVDAPVSFICPIDPATVESLNTFGRTGTDFRASSTEPAELQEYYSGTRRTILPEIEGQIDLCRDSTSGSAEPLRSVSVDISPISVELSPDANYPDMLMRNDAGRLGLDVSGLPEMSVLEKVQSWNLTRSTNSTANNECVQVPCSSTDENSFKAIEKVNYDSPENSNRIVQSILPCKQRDWLTGNTDDVLNNSCAVGVRDKLVLPEKFGKHPGTNIAVATPIFPLKNRYNISKNYPEREKPNISGEKNQHGTLRSPDDVRDPFVNSNKCFRLDEERISADRNGATKTLGSDLYPAVQDEGSSNRTDVGYERLLETLDRRRNQNFPQFCELSDDRLQNPHGKIDQVLLQHPENHQMNGFMDETRLHSSYAAKVPTAEAQLDRNQYGHSGGYDGNAMVPNIEPYRKDPSINKPNYGTVPLYANGHEDNLGSYDLSPGDVRLMLQRSNVRRDHGLHLDSSYASCVQQDIFPKEGPLDLSNKAELFVHYGRIDNGVLESLQNCAQGAHVQLLHPSGEADKVSLGYNFSSTFQAVDHRAAPGISETEEFQSRKSGIHGSLGRLKAAYKKLISKTMSVAERERELDDLEKRLLAREEAVRQKEEKLQKLLLVLTDSRSEDEVEKPLGHTRFLPPIDPAWRGDENCRSICQSGVVLPPQSRRCEPEYSRADRDAMMEASTVNGYTLQKPAEASEGAPLRYLVPRHGGYHRNGEFEYLNTPTQHVQNLSDVRHPNQPIRDSLPRENSTGQSVFARQIYVDKFKDSHSSDNLIPVSGNSWRSSSASASRDMPHSHVSNPTEKLDCTDDGIRVSSGRICLGDTGTTDMSSNSFLLRNAKESCDVSFGNQPSELIFYKSAEYDRVQWGGRPANGFSEDENITRILPPVSSNGFSAIK